MGCEENRMRGGRGCDETCKWVIKRGMYTVCLRQQQNDAFGVLISVYGDGLTPMYGPHAPSFPYFPAILKAIAMFK